MSLIRIQHSRAAKSLGICLAWMALAVVAVAQSMSTTTVQGTVYLANGAPGSGTLQISWPAFTTAANQTVAAGKITASIGADGFVSVNLAPNLGSSPAGLYYTAVYHMSDGTVSTEYWVVPGAAQASIAQVRSQVMPAAQAVQAASKAYVDQAIQSVAQGNLTSTGGQLTGPLYLTGDPAQALQAADKHYVDSSFAQALPLSGGAATGPLTATQLGAAYQVDQFSGADFGAKLQACLAAVNSNGGTCDARNFAGNLSTAANLTIATANTTVMLPCATIATASQIIVTAGTRNVSLHGCALRGASNASGSQGGTVLLYSGSGAGIQVGDKTYATDTLGFHLDNLVINTTGSLSSSAQAIAAYRTQELDIESVYLLGNASQTGMTLDGTGNYTGGTFYDNHISGFQIAINGIGHQVANSAATDWMNASTFVRLHVDCPTTNGNPISGTYGVNLQQGDGNTFTGGDVENCNTAMHLGANAQNNTIVGLRNENSTYQVVADAGSSYNSWMTGGTMFTGKLTDNGTRNSFLDTFHRSFNSLNGDWYGSQQDATLTNHLRLGIGSGNERGLLDRYQTDYGYRWTMGLSDATGGEQFYQVLDELNNVYRISVGQYNNGQASTNNQTVINAAGTGAVVLNGSNNAGTGGVVFGSGGANEITVATVSNSGNAQFNGTLQAGGTTQSTGTMTVRNNADAEVDYYLWPGLTTSQKGSFIYKDYNGNSQWYLVKDASNNWALNSAVGGLDSLKAYQSTNSGDTYVNASNATGVVRVNYEPGSGSAFNIYGGGSSNLYASFSGTSSIKLPGLSASSGRNCLQIDSSGYISNTGSACGSGSGTVNSGSTGQIAYYNGNGAAVSGMSAVPVSAGGTGATTAAGALAALNGASLVATNAQSFAGPLSASMNSQVNVMAFGAKGDGVTDDTAAFNAAQAQAITYAVGNSLPAALYLPKPTACYLLDHWAWQGVSLEGQPSGLGPASPQTYGVTICGKPGHDIIHIPDPTLTSGAIKVYAGWSIRNIGFSLNTSTAFDTTVGYTNAHRWPGRWFDDGKMTAGNNVFQSVGANITCGDVGQAIQVNGAGPTGTNLVTTIASVSPCWYSSQTSWQVVTLAAAASTTVTNAHSYISVLGLPVTTNIGNCAIAQDLEDGNGADWIASYTTGSYGKMENVVINGNGATGNYACGIYTQGLGILYGLDARNIGLYSLWAGVVQGTSELNSSLQSSSGDFETWDHVAALFGYTPWISVNGLSQQLTRWEVTARAGMQILTDGNSEGDYPVGWRIDHGFECPYGTACVYGDHITGSLHDMTADLTSGSATQYGYMDTVASKCWSCNLNNTYVDGYRNEVRNTNVLTSTTVNQGLGNIITSGYAASSFDGIPPNYEPSGAPYKGANNIAGRYTPDFLVAGNYQTPYNNDDLFIWPTDLIFASATAWSSVVVPDSTSPSGYYMVLPSNSMYSEFAQLLPNNQTGLVVGTNLPSTGATLNLMAKCPAGTTTFTPQIGTSIGGNSLTFNCTTSYAFYSVPIKWSSSNVGQVVKVGAASGSNTFYAAWMDIVPWVGSFNGYQPQQPDGSIILNYRSNWAWNNAQAGSDQASPTVTVESLPYSGAYITGANGVASTGGLLFPAQPSKITYWVGAPSIFSTTLNGAVTNNATSITLNNATTSAWGSSGYLMVDQEVMAYSGVSAGQTTVTVTRAKISTLGQAHSSGATVMLIGNGQLQVVCNGTMVSATDVFFAPTYTAFSSDFPAQKCSGYATELAYVANVGGGTGQQHNIAQVQISPQSSALNVPGAANLVPISGVQANAWNTAYAYNSSMPLVGGGSSIVTGSVGMPLSATTGSIGGSALAAATCTSGTASVTGATTGMVAAASPVAYPGDGISWRAYISTAGTATVKVCNDTAGAITPTASAYNVRVVQ